jgi:hypothetical protein
MKILFLDVDGVLNRREMDLEAPSERLDLPCIQNLNLILEATDARIVLSSSWRYMVLRGEMTLEGFEQILVTHGAVASVKIIGTTGDDADFGWTMDNNEPVRGKQIRRWMAENRARLGVTEYCVLDDEGDGIAELHSWRFVRTAGAG